MKRIKSITEISKVYDTRGSQPVLVMCEDLNFYVCKYNRHHGFSATRLFNEYLGASFLKLWKLNVPDFCIIDIDESHLNNHQLLQPIFFKTPCFGSLHGRYFKEVDNFINAMEAKEKKKFANRGDYLKIALFDMWICNEDRNFNNYNLLIDSTNDGYEFIPIDHEMIFNTSNLDKGLYLINESESLINIPLTLKLFNKNELCDKHLLTNLSKEYYICIDKCKQNLTNILDNVPDEWAIDIPTVKNLIIDNLFNDKWIKDCFKEFLTFIQIIIN